MDACMETFATFFKFMTPWDKVPLMTQWMSSTNISMRVFGESGLFFLSFCLSFFPSMQGRQHKLTSAEASKQAKCTSPGQHTGWPKKRGQRVSLQIFWKLHDRIVWKYCEYLLAYLLIIVSFDDVTLDVIVLFIFGLTLPETLCVTCSITMLLSLSQMCGHQTVRTWIRWITLFGGGALQQLVYQHRSFTSVTELKQAIVNA